MSFAPLAPLGRLPLPCAIVSGVFVGCVCVASSVEEVYSSVLTRCACGDVTTGGAIAASNAAGADMERPVTPSDPPCTPPSRGLNEPRLRDISLAAAVLRSVAAPEGACHTVSDPTCAKAVAVNAEAAISLGREEGSVRGLWNSAMGNEPVERDTSQSERDLSRGGWGSMSVFS